MTKLLQPQEIEVYYIIPSIKNELARHMKKEGINQEKIAKTLHIKKATVSQYINNKRGNKIDFNESTLNEISISAPLIKDELTFIKEMQRLIRVTRMNGTLCEIHKKLSDVPKECTPEIVNCFGELN
jgi:predicted transcriptional regulator